MPFKRIDCYFHQHRSACWLYMLGEYLVAISN